MTGLIWFGTQDYQSFTQPRHDCRQEDGLTSYTWLEYDPRTGGVQNIKDGRNNINITTEFLKIPGGDHGGSWAARIRGVPFTDGQRSQTSFIFYFSLEGFGSLQMDNPQDPDGIDDTITINGLTPDLGSFTISLVDGPDNQPVTSGAHGSAFVNRIGKTHYYGARLPPGETWKAKDVFMQAVMRNAQTALAPYKDPSVGVPDPSFVLLLPDEIASDSNLLGFQKSFEGAFQFDIIFESSSANHGLSESTLDNGIPSISQQFSTRFDNLFSSSIDTEDMTKFSKAITSNLLGGIGYFYGDSFVDRAYLSEWDREDDVFFNDFSNPDPQRAAPAQLFTATPSRSFFPRGFYWDEGFHLLHIGSWDKELGMEILESWFELLDEDGWVAREQILGDEARSKVPAEFVTQVPIYANPPTLAMALTAMIENLADHQLITEEELGLGQQILGMPKSDPRDSPFNAVERITTLYPKLKRHYEWFRRTQRGQIKQYRRRARSKTEAYRWRGRSPDHVLTSGMDDYPRGPPHSGELHLDLISWMAYFSRAMRKVAEFLNEQEDAQYFQEIEEAIVDNIEDLHWNEEEQMYCDVDVDEDEESYHVCHRGYLSIFPLLLGIIPPDSPHLEPVLDLIRSPEHLWSPYGLRSLSASHPLFGLGENYWRGPIWIQMNYLVLNSLFKVYGRQGYLNAQALETYAQLRKNIIENVFKEYKRTGYVWEQYDALTGTGRRSHPFTGWTSLVTLIIAEKYHV